MRGSKKRVNGVDVPHSLIEDVVDLENDQFENPAQNDDLQIGERRETIGKGFRFEDTTVFKVRSESRYNKEQNTLTVCHEDSSRLLSSSFR